MFVITTRFENLTTAHDARPFQPATELLLEIQSQLTELGYQKTHAINRGRIRVATWTHTTTRKAAMLRLEQIA